MQRKSDFEILVDLNNQVSRITSFLFIMAFFGITLALLVSDLKYSINQLEGHIAELKGQNDE